MSQPIVYLYQKCSTCQKAKTWLEDRGIDFEERPIKEQTPSHQELAAVATQMGATRKLFNSSGMLYREMGLSAKLSEMDDETMFSLLQSDGMLVRRPFLIVPSKGGWAGFREKQWAELLA